MQLCDRPRVAMVISRDPAEKVSRVETINKIYTALQKNSDVTQYRFKNIFEQRSAWDVITTVMTFLLSLLRLRPLPLQCLLFACPARINEMVQAIEQGGYSAVYIDSVRLYLLVLKLRNRSGQIRIICDFDDLMSRRARILRNVGLVLGHGYVSSQMPYMLRWVMSQKGVQRAVTHYEAITLRLVERQIARVANVIVLVSETERLQLQQDVGERSAQIISLVPPYDAHVSVSNLAIARPYRFVFFGSDRQLQNELSISFLLEKWSSLRPETELHVFGRQSKSWPDIARVVWRGFAPDLADAYDRTSIVLAPIVLPGGVKTKVLEGWSFARPVLVNKAGLEGIGLQDYTLLVELDAWDDFLLFPERHQSEWREGQMQGIKTILRFSSTLYAKEWASLLQGRAATTVQKLEEWKFRRLSVAHNSVISLTRKL